MSSNVKSDDLLRLSRRYAALPVAHRAEFRARVAAQKIDPARLPIARIADRATELPLSFGQEPLWFSWKLDPARVDYNVAGAVRLTGVIDAERVRTALRSLVARHEALRTRFVEREGVPFQLVQAEAEPEFELHDRSGAADAEAQVERLINAVIFSPFDLTLGPLFRAALIRSGAEEHVLVLAAHHIVCDGWSVGILLRDFVASYRVPEQELPPVAEVGYADVCAWQREWQDEPSLLNKLETLREQLGTEEPLLRLPAPRGARRGDPASVVSEPLGAELANRVRMSARAQRATPFSVLLAAWAGVLSRLSGGGDFRIGVPSAGRRRLETHAIVGYFVSTQLIRVELDDSASFARWVEQMRTRVVEAENEQDVPLSRLAEALGAGRGAGGARLFNVTFDFEHDDSAVLDGLPGVAVSEVALDAGPSKFELSLHVTETADDFRLVFDFDKTKVDEAFVRELARQYVELVDFGTARPDAAIAEAPRGALNRESWGSGAARAPELLSRVAHWAKAKPEAIALVDVEREVSWAELWAWSGAIGARLVGQGVTAESVVAIQLPRCAALVAGILAAWRAGAAYLPLDSALPAERLAFQVGDARAAALISHARPSWLSEDVSVVTPERDTTALREELRPLSEQAAYVIYTSGTSGRPKGVVVSHGSLAAYAESVVERLPDGVQSAAYVSTPAADLGHTTLFGALHAGLTLHLLSDEVATHPERFAQSLRVRPVDLLKIVPSHLAALLDAGEPKHVLPRRCLVLGGEAADPSLLKRVLTLAPELCILNHYGPTETTVGVLTHAVEGEANAAPVLGRPLAHARVYVLDARGRTVARGGVGEIAVGGIAVSRGYCGMPGLTAERFVPDPHGEPGSRSYRTGDRGRLLPSLDVEFLGRFDDQVKIRGYRIEPGEVSARLAGLPGVRAAVVVAHPDSRGGLRLIGYCVADGLDEDEISSALRRDLPAYMVPARVVILDELPRTANGKVDRRALPEPELESARASVQDAATDEERVLLDIFRQVLGRDDVGVGDDFFAVGGDSLLALRVVARAHRAGFELGVTDVFARPTVALLAAGAKRSERGSRQLNEVSGALPLTPSQARFFALNPNGNRHYNQSLLLRVHEALDVTALERALQALIARHDALRSSFERTEQGVRQRVRPRSHVSAWSALEVLEITPERLEAEANRVQRSLEPEQGGLLKVAYFSMPGNERRLLVVVHHLVVDAVSFGVLLEEIEADYERACRNENLSTDATTVPWSAWSLAVAKHAQSEELESELAYWRQQLASAEGGLVAERTRSTTFATAEMVQRWDATATQRMSACAPNAFGMRLDELLVTALAQVIAEWTGREGALVELEGHGREPLAGMDPSATVGWFTARYPVWLPVRATLAASLKSVKETLRRVPRRGIGFGQLAFCADRATRDECLQLASPEVSFNFLGRLDAPLAGSARFTIAHEAAGDAIDPQTPWAHPLDLLGVIVDGALSVHWRYDPSLLGDEVVTQLVARLESKLNELADFAASAAPTATAVDFPLARLTQSELERLSIAERDLQDVYPATALQQGLLFHGSLATGSGLYLNQRRLTLEAPVNVSALRSAWEEAVARHDILRTHFELMADGRMLQVVHRAASLPFEHHDWRQAPSYESRLAEYRREDLARGFAIDEAPLLRVSVLERPDGKLDLLWTYHHALLDGWSSSLLLAELVRGYRARLAGESAKSETVVPFRRFIEWYVEQPSAESWWREQLRSLVAPAGVCDALGVTTERRDSGRRTVELGASLSERLRDFARQRGVTLSTLVQAALALSLARYSDRPQVIFGVTVAGRPPELVGSERMLGPFINSLPVWVDVPLEVTLSDWLVEVQRRSSELRQLEQTPLQRIQEWAGKPGRSLFDCLIVFENYPVDDELTRSSVGAVAFEAVDRTHYPLTLTVLPMAELTLEWEWDGSKLDGAAVGHFSATFTSVLETMIGRADRMLCEMESDSVSPASAERSIVGGGRAAHVLERIAAQVKAQPRAEAVVCGGERWSYEELWARATAIAGALDVAPGAAVGVCVARTPGLIAACLGVWLAGAAYVPLEAALPEAQLQFRVVDAGISAIVTDAASANVVTGIPVVRIDSVRAGGRGSKPTHRHALAYVIYTSGSTGQPKGVAVEHDALARHIDACLDAYHLTPNDRVFQFSTLLFDAAVEQIFATLAAGATLIMRGDELLDADQLQAILSREAVSVLDLPTAYFQRAASAISVVLPALRLITVGGEELSAAAVARWFRGALASVPLLNAYGPTEATVTCSVHRVRASDASVSRVPIGAALPGRRMALVDSAGREAPRFGVGEICVAGPTLARGYLGRPGETAGSFVPDPAAPGGRLYRTGDRGRYDENGVVAFLGRNDEQVKIRGYRIELGEVEAALRRCVGVNEAAVAVVGADEQHRIAAYVAGDIDARDTRRQLERLLPAYALPSTIDVLSTLPLTSSGKVDRQALPEPALPADRERTEPTNVTEERLLSVFRAVLARPELGVGDKLFEAGGDSISTLQIVMRARALGIEITPRQVFEHQSVAELARVATFYEGGNDAPEVHDELPLAPSQRWFFALHPDGEPHFNQSVLLRVPATLKIAALERALGLVVARHDALRLRFFRRDGAWYQQVMAERPAERLDPVDLTGAADWRQRLEQHADALQRSLDCGVGRVFRAAYFKLDGDEARLLLIAHHLVIDGVSWRVLLSDLETLLSQGEARAPVRTPWSAWVARTAATGPHSPRELPAEASATIDGIEGDSHTALGDLDEIETALDSHATKRLLHAGVRPYRADAQDLLLAALARTLAPQNGVLVDVEGYGRGATATELDVSETIGWFTTELPIWLESQPDLGREVRAVKESLRELREHAARSQGLERGAQLQPRVGFNYLGNFDGVASSSLFAFAHERAGVQAAPTSRTRHALEVSCLIESGRLVARFRYDRRAISAAVARAWASRFEAELGRIIEHCQGALPVATPSDFPLARLSASQLAAIDVTGVSDIYPASPAQQGIVFHALAESGLGLYVDQLRIVFGRRLDAKRLRAAWESAIQRHDVLRTRFEWRHGGEPLQVVMKSAPLELSEQAAITGADYEAQVRGLLAADLALGVELDRAPLMRLQLLQRPDGAHDLVWTSHHALLDGWSTTQLLAEVLDVYRGVALPVTEPPPYREYVAWLGARHHDRSWWQARFSARREPAGLFTHLGRRTSGEPRASAKLVQPAELGTDHRLRERARALGVTLNTLTQAAWALVLARRGNRDQAVFGITVSGRPPELAGVEAMLGLFIHSLPLWLDVPEGLPVDAWLDTLQALNVELRQHEDTPLAELQRLAGQPGEALFDSLLVFENYPVDARLVAPSDDLEVLRIEKQDRTHFPFTLTVRPEPTLEVEYEWDESQVDAASARALARDFASALEWLSRSDASTRVGDFSLPAPAHVVPANRRYWPIAARIQAQASVRPTAVAIWCEGVATRYAELARWSSWLEREIWRARTNGETLVGLCMKRGPELVGAVLGVWKAGAAVVPLDPDYPPERLRRMLRGIDLVVTDSTTSSRLRDLWRELEIQEICFERSAPPSANAPARVFEPAHDSLAYVIYTSGSSGEPKGVAVSQGSLSAHVDDFLESYGISDVDTQLFSSTVNFDVWLHEVFPALTQGGRVVMRGEAAWELSTLTERLREQEVTFARVSTAYFGQWVKWLKTAPASELPRHLRQVTTGGEGLSGAVLRDYFSGPLSGVKLDNLYGPTETTVAALSYRTSEADIGEAVVPIGAPFGSRSARVMDSWGRDVPVGGVGELCIGGVTVARGYLGRPSETAERFVPDASGVGARLYRSGDLSRMRWGGTVEFLGRGDEQIKLRGYRIELGEIESALLTCQGVKSAAAAVRGEGEHRRLVGYVTGDVEVGALKSELEQKLPAHLRPSAYVVLASLPLTNNGKLDRKSLPEPAVSESERRLEPRTAAERALQEIWQSVLKLETVGLDDNYFELGGDSILSLQIIATARQRGWQLTPKQLFEQPTIESLARVAVASTASAVEQGEVLGELPLTPIQARFFEQHPSGPSHYNQSVLLQVKGELDVAALERTLLALVNRHDALRLRFSRRDGVWTQQVQAEVEAPRVNVVALGAVAELAAAGERVQRSLSIEQGPLLRAEYFTLPEGDGRLLLVVHHLAVDGVSWRVLLDELAQAYDRAERALPLELPPISSPFSVWATELRRYAQREQLRTERRWWEDNVPASVEPSRAPADKSLRASQAFEIELDAVETQRLLESAPRAYRMRVDEVLLTALVRALAETNGRSGVLVELEGHGRETVSEQVDVSRTVGWFTTRFPLWLEAESAAAASLVQVKERLRAVPVKGFHFGLFRYSQPTDLGAFSVPFARPDVSFNYLGQFDQALQSGGRFTFASENAGTDVDLAGDMAHGLSLNALIANGCLSVSLRLRADFAKSVSADDFVATYARTLRELIEHCAQAPRGATASDFPLARLSQAQLERLDLPLAQVDDLYPATPLQQGFVFHGIERSTDGVYVYQLCLTLSGELKVPAFEAAWRELLARHAVLRTHFDWRHAERVLQVVRQRVVVPFSHHDWSRAPDYDARFAAFRRDDVAAGFDLAQAPLFRVSVFARPDGMHDVVWTVHHAISDGWSSARLVNELIELYAARAQGLETAGNSVRPYRDYVQWLASRPDTSEWWQRVLTGHDAAAKLEALGRARALEAGTHHLRAALPQGLSRRVEERAKRAGVTLNTMMQAAWGLVLARYGNRSAAIFGTTVSGRPPELNGSFEMIGLFINTVPVLVNVPADLLVSAWLVGLQRVAAELPAHEHTPLSDIQRHVGGTREGLFDTLLVFENFPVDKSSRSRDLGVRIERSETADRTHYPLTLTVEAAGAIELEWEWDGSRVERGWVTSLSRHFEEVLEQLAADGEQLVGDIELSGRAAQEARSRREFRGVAARIDAQSRARAGARALWCETEWLSYGQLGSWSSAVARRLMATSVSSEKLVGLCLQRGVGLPAGVLGIWKAGGAVVPLDPSYPVERLRRMLRGVEVVLVDAATKQVLREVAVEVPVVELGECPASEAAEGWDFASVRSDSLAYVIYTSGSSGEPKGVAVSQGSLSAHVDDFLESYGISDVDTQLFSSTVNFDVWLHEVFPALTQGGRVVMRGEAAWELSTLTERLREQEVTFARVSTAYFGQWVKWLKTAAASELPRHLRQVTTGGEGLSGAVLRDYFSGPLSGVKLDNLYGPTETTVAALSYRTSEADIGEAVVPIGAPFGSRSARVMDSWGRDVPVGGVGELCIGGVTVARGYLGRPSETAERFVPDASGVGARLYRSGDLSRMRWGGTVEFLGRGDEQIKLRGYRIELGEIESALLTCQGVKSAAAAVRGEGEHRRLVGYVTGDVEVGALKSGLEQKLPAHLRPSAYVVLASLPLTNNGKLDRKSLPEPAVSESERRLEPRTAAERALQEIWQSVLKLETVGLDDNYFELGGDSILSLQIIATARQRGWQLTPKQLFEQPTIESLARVAVASTASAVEQGEVLGELPLTPIQARFFEQHPSGPSHYNQSVLLQVKGELDVAALERTLLALVSRHDALRLRFSRRDGVWTQQVQAEVEAPRVNVVALGAVGELAAAGERVQRSLSIEQGPLLRAEYFTLPEGDGRLLLVVHHLAVDGVSWRVLLDELAQAYDRAERALPLELPPISSPFSLWTSQLAQHAARAPLADSLSWWERTLASSDAALPGLAHANRDPELSRVVRWKLDAASTESLLRHTARAYRMKPDEVLLAALTAALASTTGTRGALVDLEGHGREAIVDGVDLSRTLGWFTSRFPVWLDAHIDVAAGLIATKERLRGVPGKGVDWGLARYLGGGALAARTLALPEPWLSFNYLGRFDEVLSEAGRFGFAGEDSGEATDPTISLRYALDINGLIADGTLSVSFRYVPDAFSEATIEELVSTFDGQVRSVLAHVTVTSAQPTASDFTLAGLDQAHLEALALPLHEIEDIYPATPIQQGLILEGMLAPERGAYINQLRLTLRGSLDRAAMRGAWQAAVDRHPILRTHFEWRHGGQALQVVHRHRPLPYAEHDWSQEAHYEARFAEWLRADQLAGFSLEQAPLVRLAVFLRPDGGYDLVRTSHHALSDGWSSEQLFAEILEDYAARRLGPPPQRSAAPPFRDYVAWLLSRPSPRDFWQRALANLDEPAQALTSIAVPSAPVVSPDSFKVLLGTALSRHLRDRAKACKVTLNTLMQGAWALVLARLGDRRQALFGATVSGRPPELAEADRMLGPFINSLPVLVQLPDTLEVGAWLAELQRAASELRQFEYTPLPDIKRWLGRSSDELFDSLIVFENYPTDDELLARDVGLTLEHSELVDLTHYPVVLTIVPNDDEIEIEWEWRGDRIHRADIERLSAHYRFILERLAADEQQPLGALGLDPGPSLSTPCEDDASYRSVMSRVTQQAAQQPDALAVVCQGTSLSYGELTQWSNRVAGQLRASGVTPGERVAVALERGVELVPAILGVLTARAAFVPLDPSYPRERTRAILHDARVRHIVTDAATRARLGQLLDGVEVIDVFAENAGFYPAPQAHPEQLAYVIYTSGTSGEPKGVGVSQRALATHVDDYVSTYALSARDRVYQFSTIQFDASLEQLFPALCVGATVVMRGPAVPTLPQLNLELMNAGVTVMDLPTGFWQHWLEDLPPALPALRLVTVGGEALPAEALRRWQAGPLASTRLDNSYGPTETTIAVCYRETSHADADCARVPIGAAYPRRSVRVLDAAGNNVPRGGLGELCIGGASVARGYEGRPAATAERFTPDPLGEPGARVYRTGDVVRIRDDGALEFFGRRDQQVKLRGYRIELSAIEEALRRASGCAEVAVALHGVEQHARLVGYVVGEVDVPAVLAKLADELPHYMLPSDVLGSSALPLTGSGKVDRKALPDRESPVAAIVAARTPLEAQLHAVWQRVLGRADFGVTQDFFALGGDSLTALRVAAGAAELGLAGFSMEALFSGRTIEALAASLEQAGSLPGNVLRLNARTSGPSLFCIHPLYGTVAGYAPLAAALNGAVTVYGVQSPAYSEPEWHADSLQGIARDYVERIRSVQPHGPYAILGWSLGGWLAAAMAYELEQVGESLAFVGLVDVRANISRDGFDRAAIEQEFAASVRDARQSSRLELARELQRSNTQGPLAVERRNDTEAALLDSVLRVIVQHEELLTRHEVSSVVSPLHVWHAAKHASSAADPRLGWEQFTPLAIGRSVDATHVELIAHPLLATEIREILRNG